jgi:hypothetical protein
LGFWLTDPCMTIKHLQFESLSAVLSFLCICKKLSSVHIPSFDSNLNIPWWMSDFPLAVIEGFFLNFTGSWKKIVLGFHTESNLTHLSAILSYYWKTMKKRSNKQRQQSRCYPC